MNLCRKILLTVIVGAVTACHDTSAPLHPVTYVLTAIDGRSVPTFLSQAPHITVLSGSFLLDGGSQATSYEHRRDFSGNEYLLNVTYHYTIAGNVVELAIDHLPPCPGAVPGANCAIVPNATISGNHLLIDYDLGRGGPLYDYQIGGGL